MPKKKFVISSELARKVKEIRRLNGLTQAGLSALTKTSPSYIAHLENGSIAPSLEFAFKIEQGLKITNGALSKIIIEAHWQAAANSLAERRYKRSTPPPVSLN